MNDTNERSCAARGSAFDKGDLSSVISGLSLGFDCGGIDGKAVAWLNSWRFSGVDDSRWAEKANASRFFGEPVSDMSRRELLAIVGVLVDRVEAMERDAASVVRIHNWAHRM